MAEERRTLRVRNAPAAVFLPAAALLVAVPLLMATPGYDVLGLYAIFGAFVVGVALTVAAEVSNHLRAVGVATAEGLLALGVSLGVAAVGLYLAFGCVFGCPA